LCLVLVVVIIDVVLLGLLVANLVQHSECSRLF
jgi:hypothetical protein